MTAGRVVFRGADAAALDDVSVEIHRGHVTGIAGPNGSGKTTLLRSFFGAQRLTSGAVHVEGRDLRRLRAREIARMLSVVSQFDDGCESLRVRDLVLMGRAPYRRDVQGWDRRDREIADDALDRVGLSNAASRHVRTLSGGERQRVLIARAMTQQGGCMLLDEPTNHLDIRYQHQILGLVRDVAPTAVVVLHDLNLVARYCDEVLVMNGGRVVANGPPAVVLTPALIAEVWGAHATVVPQPGFPQFVLGPGHEVRARTTPPG